MSDEPPTKQISAWIPPSLHKWLRQYAHDRELSHSQIIRELLEAKRQETSDDQ